MAPLAPLYRTLQKAITILKTYALVDRYPLGVLLTLRDNVHKHSPRLVARGCVFDACHGARGPPYNSIGYRLLPHEDRTEALCVGSKLYLELR